MSNGLRSSAFRPGDYYDEKRKIHVAEDGLHTGEFHARKVWDYGADRRWKNFKDRIEPYYDQGVVGFRVGSQFLELIPVGYVKGVGWKDITPRIWKKMRATPIIERENHYLKFGAEMVTLPGMTGFGWRKEGTFNLTPVYKQFPAISGVEPVVENVLAGFNIEDKLFLDISDLFVSERRYRLNGGRLEIEVKPNNKEIIDPGQTFFVSAFNRDGYIAKVGTDPPGFFYVAYPTGTIAILGKRPLGASDCYFYPGGFDTSGIGSAATITYARLVFKVAAVYGPPNGPQAYVIQEGDRIGNILDISDYLFSGTGCGAFSGLDYVGWKWLVFSSPYAGKINVTGSSDYEVRHYDFPLWDWGDWISIYTAESAQDPYLRVDWTLPGASKVQASEGAVGSVNPVNTGGNVP